MILETNRLILREYSKEDSDNYYKLKSCKEVWKFSTNEPISDYESAKMQLHDLIESKTEKDIGFCAIINKNSNEYIGEAGILTFNKAADRCVIGYNLLPEYWNNGFATEITKELIKYAFENLSTERVEALAMNSNVASVRVLEKSGMKKEGVLRHFAKLHGIYYDVCCYGIIKEDFKKFI